MRLLRGGLLALLLLLVLAFTVSADQTPVFVGPEAVYAREVFEVVLWIDQPGVTKVTGLIVTDQEHLELMGIFSADTEVWKTGSNTIEHVFECLKPADAQKQPVFRVRLQVRSVEEGTKIWVAMKNVVLWVGDTPVEIGDIYWEREVAHIISDDNYLTALRLSDCAISPEFSPYQQNYTATVSHEVGQVRVEALPSNPAALVQVDSPMLELGKTTDVTVTVTAEDGSQRVYTIAVTREDSPERIPSNNCDLESLEVTDFLLSPEFAPEVTDYVLWLPYEITKVEVTATAADSRAKVTISGNSGFKAGQDNLIHVICTAEDGTQKVYSITAKRAPAHTEQATMPANGAVYTDTNEVPVWVYVIVAVVAAAGCTAVGILIGDRKK